MIVLAALILDYGTSLIRNAERENSSYQKLCDLGATGDDWISFKEVITGRPPIVQLNIPATVQPDFAIELLPDLGNLESLTIAFDSPTNSDLDVIKNLGLHSIEFCGTFPRDKDVERMKRFGRLKFVCLQTDQLSSESVDRLRLLLPNTRIDVRWMEYRR